MVKAVTNRIQWANALSTRPSLEAAIEEVVERTQQSLPTADLGLVFITASFASEYSRLMPLLKERLPTSVLIGCSGGGVIGMNAKGEAQEVEGEPGLSLSLVNLPNVRVKAFHITGEELPDLDSPPDSWVNLIGVSPSELPQFVLLAEAFSSRVNDLIQGLDFAYPGAIKIGGLASGTPMGGATGLFCNYRLYREGTVGIALSGNIILEPIVAQGCRPIGQPFRVTAGERNIVTGLEEATENITSKRDSRSPLEMLRNLIQNLSYEDRMLAQNSLFVGIVRDEFKQVLQQGDFLIRQLLGVDPKSGAIAIGDRVRPGQRIQFHLRDANTSAEDLELLLQHYQRQALDNPGAAGALMFSCLGRGEGLYGEPNFDSRLFHRYLKNIPLGGFFCHGEIGPVAGNTFLHGYTSIFGICHQL